MGKGWHAANLRGTGGMPDRCRMPRPTDIPADAFGVSEDNSKNGNMLRFLMTNSSGGG